MTVTIDAEAKKLLQRLLQSGVFANASKAVQAAVRQMFVYKATPELESLLDDALRYQGTRVPLSELLYR